MRPRHTCDSRRLVVRCHTRIGRRLKLRDLHVLFAVMQSGSMAKAAQQLAVSQPVVSTVIASLEHALGVRHLDLSRRGVEPTIYGLALFNHGTAAFDALRQGITSASAAERRTGSRSLRGTILAGSSPPCAHDDDCLRFPPASPPYKSEAGKKEPTGRRLNQACPPCDAPSSTSSPDRRLSNARTADDRSSKDSRVNQSAKIVLDNPAQVDKVIEGFGGTARKHLAVLHRGAASEAPCGTTRYANSADLAAARNSDGAAP